MAEILQVNWRYAVPRHSQREENSHSHSRPQKVEKTKYKLRGPSSTKTRPEAEDRLGRKRGPRPKTQQSSKMSKYRRKTANARERQRVHTITAAFDTLQAAIPTEEKDIKLSKLSVIKIATAYIMALSRMAGHDYTEDQSAPPVEEVVEHCSEVIEKECRIKKRNGSQ